MDGALSHIDLTPAEIRKLPADVRRKVEAAFGPVDKVSGDWMLVGAQSAAVASLINVILPMLTSVMAVRSKKLHEESIEKLLEVFADSTPRPQVDIELDMDNAKLRAEFLAETQVLTAADVRQLSGLTPRNKSEPASRWKREGKLFAVRRAGVDLYPAFQFKDGQARPIIKDVLAMLPDTLSPWQIAFWFVSGNSWLEGEAPVDGLDRPEEVIEAARQLVDPAIG